MTWVQFLQSIIFVTRVCRKGGIAAWGMTGFIKHELGNKKDVIRYLDTGGLNDKLVSLWIHF